MKIEGLNTGRALQCLGSEKLYWSVLKDYYHMIDKKADLIKTLEEKEDWKRYMIEVHALKSISKQIGAEELSKLAAEMEQAGNRGDAGVKIRIHHIIGGGLCSPLFFYSFTFKYTTANQYLGVNVMLPKGGYCV